MASRPSPALVALLPLALATACGSSHGGYALDVGGDDSGGIALSGVDAAPAVAFDAHIEENHVTVTFVTVGCSGACADVEAVPTGGTAPYVYAWDDGSTSATRRVCPASSTSYHVRVTDTGTSGELGHPAQSVQVPLDARVVSCPDGGTLDAGTAGTGPCDSVADVSPTGANPFGPWSYGSTPSLGGAFTRQTQYVTMPTTNTFAFSGLVAWTSGVNGIELNPGAYFNPGNTADDILTNGEAGAPWVIPARQFLLHPGPTGQYSIARWTAPAAGSYVVSATFVGLAQAPAMTTTDVHVQRNGADLPGTAGSINVNGGANTVSATISVTVAAGDTLDFAVGDGGNTYLSDTTGLTAKVCKAAARDGG